MYFQVIIAMSSPLTPKRRSKRARQDEAGSPTSETSGATTRKYLI